MHDLSLHRDHPLLLVSVRNAEEAFAALAGGAQIIDVKEPQRGSLGAADYATTVSVVEAVRGRAPVTMALGELAELLAAASAKNTSVVPPGISLFKIGLADCARVPNWQDSWRRTVDRLRRNAQPVAVAYADWKSANAPAPQEVLAAAITAKCQALLIDTWQKGYGGLFDHWTLDEVRQFARRVRESGIAIVLAGSLAGQSVQTAVRLRPNVVAVRGAVCTSGRESSLSTKRVAALRELIGQCLFQEKPPL